jgi:hypothetical protein
VGRPIQCPLPQDNAGELSTCRRAPDIRQCDTSVAIWKRKNLASLELVALCLLCDEVPLHLCGLASSTSITACAVVGAVKSRAEG